MKDKKYLALAAQVPCIVCMNQRLGDTPATLHHVRNHTGLALKGSDYDVIALCKIHHQGQYGSEFGYHHSPKAFEEKYGTQQELLEQMKEKVEALKEMYV